MRLGLLDFSSIRKGQSPAERVFETIEMARHADALGYSRYWLAEHHELNYAHHSPELLMGMIAGSTEHLRVGVAGVLLLLHSPLRIAKAFRLLEGLFGGRVDLGVGSGYADQAVAEGMRYGDPSSAYSREDYQQRVLHLLAHLRNESAVKFNPLDAGASPVWLLGAGSPETAALAARHGTCFGLSLAHNKSRDDPSVMARYLEEFRPSGELSEPQCVIAVAGLCAETEEEARRLANDSFENPRSGLEVVGTPRQCHERLQELCARYRTDEIIFLNMSPDYDSQLRSLQLLSDALRLKTAA